MTRHFIWEESTHPPIGLDHLYQPKDRGGINLLDIRARNEAIELTWLRDYLNLGTQRPSWAFITDILINRLAPSGIASPALLNTFLQQWDVPVRGARANTLPPDVLSMLRAARKHGVAFAPAQLSLSLKRQLPAFYHLGAPPRTYAAPKISCLIHNHQVRTVSELITASRRLTNLPNNERHHPRRNCRCLNCAADRQTGCKNPHKCALAAHTILNSLSPKTNPTSRPPSDDLTLTHRRLEKNRQAHRERGAIIFDPSMTARTSLAECFRIFVDPDSVPPTPAYRLQHPTPGISLEPNRLTVYTDGSCSNNGKANARAGSGIYVSASSPYNRAIRVDGPDQSNQVGELVAVIVA
ncbi:hypothetical protein NEOLEDRAFT_1079750, partial [Neolentinus lepideus HHB14362 ss-1]